LAAEARELVEDHGHGPTPARLAQEGEDVPRDAVVHVPDEAQRDVVVLGVDPARARQAAPVARELKGDFGGDLEAGEKAGHRYPLSTNTRDTAHPRKGAPPYNASFQAINKAVRR